MTMLYRHITTHCDQPIARELKALEPVLAELKTGKNTAAAPLFALPARTDDVVEILAGAAAIKKIIFTGYYRRGRRLRLKRPHAGGAETNGR
jgi:hypothetical protein